MIRSCAIALFVACAVIGCGRQITPNPPGLGSGGATRGYMVVTLDVAAPFDFTNYQYWIVFDTSGNGLTPLTNPTQNCFSAFSDEQRHGNRVHCHVSAADFYAAGAQPGSD